MPEISWNLVAMFAASGVGLALLSCLVGLKPKIENPLWWIVYLAWIAVAVGLKTPAIFSTLLVSSVAAGLVHGITTALLLDRYIANNPWHAADMQGSRSRYAIRFITTGLTVGLLFGLFVAGLGWGIARP